MNEVLYIVLPVFGIVALGYLTARTGYLSQSVGDALADFVVKIAVPVLLIRSLSIADFGDVSPWDFIAVYGTALLTAWAVAALTIVFIFKRGHRASVIAGVSASFSNLVMLGIPLVERAYGAAGLQVLFFLIAFHVPFMVSFSTFLMEHAVRADGIEESPLRIMAIAKSLARNLAINPMVIGIIIGLLWRFSGIPTGGFVGPMMDFLARTTGPLALFSIGMGLIKYGIKGNLAPAIVLACLSLLLMPATAYVLGTYVFNLPTLWLKVAILASACPTGMNAYLFATYFKIAQGLATNTIILALLGSIVTIPLWLSLVP